MSCEKSKRRESCVTKIVKDIVVAQNDVVRKPSCKTGCAQSISDLLNQGDCHSHDMVKPDTVPVILYCKSTCEPFVGIGASDESHSLLEKSKIFRVNEVTHDNCAVVELLRSACDGDDGHHKRVDKLEGTGICITVDLSCFCHISCLPAIALR